MPDTQGTPVAELLGRAGAVASELGHSWIGIDHVLLALLHEDAPGEAREILGSLGVFFYDVKVSLQDEFGDPFSPSKALLTLTPRVQLAMQRAEFRASELGQDEANSEHVLLALTDDWLRAPTTAHLAQHGITADVVRQVISNRINAPPQSEEVAQRPAVVIATEESLGDRARDSLPGLELKPNPLGHPPQRRKPWGSAMFLDEMGRPLSIGSWLCQYFVDRDGFPVLTRDGQPVHVHRHARARPLIGPVDVPKGSRIRNHAN